MGAYIPATDAERQAMLDAVHATDMAALMGEIIPQEAMLERALLLPHGLAEREVRQTMADLAEKNVVFKSIFRGAGAYQHYIPSAVKQITSKEEFVTAYTPYQAEISQGLLQGIFEYQTMICELTTMDASNASIYDGATAAAEAVAMCRDRKRTTALVSAAAHPNTIRTVQTYCAAQGYEVVVVPMKDGRTDATALAAALTAEVACLYLEQPNYYGVIEEAEALGELVHQGGAKLIMGCNPVALAILKSPSACGADIVTGEGQPLGMPLAFGGPYLGFMACKSALTRKLPGRIVGETTDVDGNRAYVLTLQAREQHIRREKASSNVCSNQALCAMTAAVYLSVMGPAGMVQVAQQSMSKAAYLAEGLAALGYKRVFDGDYFHEFVTTCPLPVDQVLATLEAHGILGGYPLTGELAGNLLWCATENNTKGEIDRLLSILQEVSA